MNQRWGAHDELVDDPIGWEVYREQSFEVGKCEAMEESIYEETPCDQ